VLRGGGTGEARFIGASLLRSALRTPAGRALAATPASAGALRGALLGEVIPAAAAAAAAAASAAAAAGAEFATHGVRAGAVDVAVLSEVMSRSAVSRAALIVVP